MIELGVGVGVGVGVEVEAVVEVGTGVLSLHGVPYSANRQSYNTYPHNINGMLP